MAEEDEELDTKVASENARRRCGIGTNFYGRICWSNLELDSLIEPQQEVREKGDKTEDVKTKQLESMLAEKDKLIDTMKKDLKDLESSNAQTEKSLAESETVIERLKANVQRQKDSEKRLFDSFVTQTLQLEQAMIFIDNWKQKVASVKERTGITSYEENYWLRLQVERLENELRVQMNGQNPWDEVMRLRKELEQAIEGDDNSKRAMDDLAVVIKEVALEANQTKDKVTSTEQQLQNAKEEAENLKSMIGINEKAHLLALKEAKIAEEKNRMTLSAAKKENESLKGTIDRLKIIVKEQLPSLNGKDIEFIDSIKREEDEKVNTQEEKNRLVELLNGAKDESRKLRYILQQAKVEIAQLKDALAEKENAIVALTLENEKLMANEAATNNNMKELKRQIPSHSRKDSKSEEKEQKKKESSSDKDSKGGVKLIGDLKRSWKSFGDLKAKDSMSEEKEKKKNNKENSYEKDSKGDKKQYGDLTGSWKSIGDLKSSAKSAGLFCSIQLLVPSISKHKGVVEEHKTDEDLTDSIFDLVEPDSGKHHHTRSASAVTFTEDERSVNSEDFEEPHVDDIEIEKRSHRKRKVLLKRFSELWKRKSHNRSHSHSSSHSHSHSHSRSNSHSDSHKSIPQSEGSGK